MMLIDLMKRAAWLIVLEKFLDGHAQEQHASQLAETGSLLALKNAMTLTALMIAQPANLDMT